MDEEPIWAWENIVYKNYETLKPAARALARSSAVYADELVKKGHERADFKAERDGVNAG